MDASLTAWARVTAPAPIGGGGGGGGGEKAREGVELDIVHGIAVYISILYIHLLVCTSMCPVAANDSIKSTGLSAHPLDQFQLPLSFM